jgi:hypothetical protein
MGKRTGEANPITGHHAGEILLDISSLLFLINNRRKIKF